MFLQLLICLEVFGFLKHTTWLVANATASGANLMSSKGKCSSLSSTSLFLDYAPSSLIQSSASLSLVKLNCGFRLAFLCCIVHRALSLTPLIEFPTKIKTKQTNEKHLGDAFLTPDGWVHEKKSRSPPNQIWWLFGYTIGLDIQIVVQVQLLCSVQAAWALGQSPGFGIRKYGFNAEMFLWWSCMS